MGQGRTSRLLTLGIVLITMLTLSACISRTNTDPEPTPSPEPTATAAPVAQEVEDEESATSDPGAPVRFQIDQIDVDAEIENVAKDDQGRMDVPKEPEDVAWYELGPVPGEQGNAVLAGHYDSFSGPAVFYKLNELNVGDSVRVVTEDDEELEFEVVEIERVHIDDADSEKIFGKTEGHNLNLVTCEGSWDFESNMYDHRFIVYTTLVDA